MRLVPRVGAVFVAAAVVAGLAATPAPALDVVRVTVTSAPASVACTTTITTDDEWSPTTTVRGDETACTTPAGTCVDDYDSGGFFIRSSDRGCTLTAEQVELICAEQERIGFFGAQETRECAVRRDAAYAGCRESVGAGFFGRATLRECVVTTGPGPVELAITCRDHDLRGEFGMSEAIGCRTAVLEAGCSSFQGAFGDGGSCTITTDTPLGTQSSTYCTSPMPFFDPLVGEAFWIPTRLEPAPPEGCSTSA